MRTDEIRQAIECAPKTTLPQIIKALSQAFTGGRVTEAEFEELQGLIDNRNTRTAPQVASPHRVGSRPRSPASIERRRRWAASGALPPGLAAHFTTAELAALAVVVMEVREHGDCRLVIGKLAALAGVGETSVRNALKEGRRLGLVTVEERRVSAFRNLSNIVRIVSTAWVAWLRLSPRGGFKFLKGTNNQIYRYCAHSTGSASDRKVAAGMEQLSPLRSLRERR